MTINWGFAHEGFEIDDERLTIITGNGFGHVELRVANIDRDGPLFDRDVAARLRAIAAQAQLSLSLHGFSGVNLGEKVDRIREACVEIVADQLRFGELIGAKWLTVHLGSCGFAGDTERKRRRLDFAIQAIERLLELTKSAQIKIALENLHRLPAARHKSYLGDSAEEFRVLLDALPTERVGVLFDIGHAQLDPCGDRLGFLRAVSSRVLGVHVHDNDGHSDMHAALAAEWPASNQALFEELLRLGASGVPLILEHHDVAKILQSKAVVCAAQ